ncbi:hypothetical protein QBC47DRAFT_429616, partial [Echria macrotheca]
TPRAVECGRAAWRGPSSPQLFLASTSVTWRAISRRHRPTRPQRGRIPTGARPTETARERRRRPTRCSRLTCRRGARRVDARTRISRGPERSVIHPPRQSQPACLMAESHSFEAPSPAARADCVDWPRQKILPPESQITLTAFLTCGASSPHNRQHDLAHELPIHTRAAPRARRCRYVPKRRHTRYARHRRLNRPSHPSLASRRHLALGGPPPPRARLLPSDCNRPESEPQALVYSDAYQVASAPQVDRTFLLPTKTNTTANRKQPESITVLPNVANLTLSVLKRALPYHRH